MAKKLWSTKAHEILAPVIGDDLASQVVSKREGKGRVKPFDAYRATITLEMFMKSPDPRLAAWEYVNRDGNSVVLTHEYLTRCHDYDPLTGQFRSKVATQGREAGLILGSIGSHGYLSVVVAKRSYLAHRLAWFYMHAEWPEQIDHIDRNKINNRLANLRACTHAQNNWNKGPVGRATVSGVKGVVWFKERQKWVARIGFNKKRKTLGYFTSLDEAAVAYQEAVTRYHGVFAGRKVANV